MTRPVITQTTTQLMVTVIMSLCPGIFLTGLAFGANCLKNLLIACIVGLLSEGALLKLRQAPIIETLKDGSILLTALLFCLSLPPGAPWWLVVLGTLFASLIGKQVYGGLGSNLFNPAMVGYVFCLVTFPLEMGQWTLPFDAVTGATPLDAAGFSIRQESPVASNTHGFEWISLSYLLSGIYLLWRRIIHWRIPLSFLFTLLLLNFCQHICAPETNIPLVIEFLTQSTFLGAFFILTDPVTASTTPRGQLLFGMGAGALTFFIRHFGNYADGFAFSVLIMNLCAPALDLATKPRVFGRS